LNILTAECVGHKDEPIGIV